MNITALQTAQEPETRKAPSDADTVRIMEQFEVDMDDGRHVNFAYLWSVATAPENQHLKGLELVTLMSLASLTKIPSFGCRASHTQVTRRANAIRPVLALAHEIGWKQIMRVLGLIESVGEQR